MLRGERRRARRAIAPVVLAGPLVLVGLASSCAPPPAACPPTVRVAQKDAFVAAGGTWNDTAEWLFGWYWSDPANCIEPTDPDPDPEEPTPVVPEAPAAILLPAGAVLISGGALVWSRRRRPSAA